MQCAACGGFFQYPSSDKLDKSYYMYCPKCRHPSEYDYSYTSREYHHEHLTNTLYTGDIEES